MTKECPMTKRRSRRPLRLFWSNIGHWGLVIHWSLVMGHWSLGGMGPNWSLIQRQWGRGEPYFELNTHFDSSACFAGSVIEQEFLRAEEGPINVLHGRAALGVLGVGQGFEEFFLFDRGREAGETSEADFLDECLLRGVGGQEFGDGVILRGQLLVEGVAVGDVEHLGHARLGGALAFAGFLAVGAAEGFEEVGKDLGIGELQGAQAKRVTLAQSAVLVAQVDPEFTGNAR